ncbi:MAG: VOC family protein [Vulcanimicrobiota bacterium]
MALKKMDHVSVFTRKPQEETDFYQSFFNFKIVYSHISDQLGIKVIHLKNEINHLEIITPVSPQILTIDGIKHLAFESDDIQEDFENFRSKGVEMLHDKVQYHEKSALFFIRTPGGEILEIIQH